MKTLSKQMAECLSNCQECHRVCLQMVMTHCLEKGGAHVAPAHFQLMYLCSLICETSAKFLLIGSDLHKETCRACGVVCEQCAKSCEELGDMDECVRACKRCAVTCKAMAGGD
jgi:hypothetical protein